MNEWLNQFFKEIEKEKYNNTVMLKMWDILNEVSEKTGFDEHRILMLSLYGSQNYEMDNLSYAIYKTEDLSAMRRKRRENAHFLHDNLQGVKFIGELTENAVPLFVPIFFETTEQRDAVRKKLILLRLQFSVHVSLVL